MERRWRDRLVWREPDRSKARAGPDSRLAVISHSLRTGALGSGRREPFKTTGVLVRPDFQSTPAA